jgi:hypothetical protein
MMNEHERSRLAHLYSRIKDSNSALLEIDSIFDLEELLKSAGNDRRDRMETIRILTLDPRNREDILPLSKDRELREIDNTIKAIEDRTQFLRQRHFLQQIEQNEKIKEIESREAQQSVTQVISDGEKVKRPTQAQIAKFYRVLEYFDFKENTKVLGKIAVIRGKRHGFSGENHRRIARISQPINNEESAFGCLDTLGGVGRILYDELMQSDRKDHIPKEITHYYSASNKVKF